MKKKKVIKVDITTTETLSLEDLALRVVDTVGYENIPRFIALLDISCESWEITNDLINHFEALKQAAIKEEVELELAPKDLLENDKK